MIQEFRHGLRLLGRNRGFAAIGILTLALGIGANTAMFSIVNGVLLNPFPYPATDSLMFVSAWSAQFNVSVPLTYADYLDLRHDSRLFQHLAAARGSGFNLTEAAREPARVKGATVSANAFPLLGMQPALGRTLQEADDREGAERVAVISHALWTTRYDGDPGVIGRSIGLDGQTYTVVGVMPAAFKFWAADVWVPIGLNFLGEFQHSRVVRSDMFGVGRLAPGVTREQAQAELDVITKRLQQAYPDTNRDIGVRRGAAQGVSDGEHPAHAPRPARCRRLRAAHRVRQRRQPAPRAGGDARTRAGGAYRARRESRAPGAPAPVRGGPARPARRDGRSRPGALVDARRPAACAGRQHTGRSCGRRRLARARLHGWNLAR